MKIIFLRNSANNKRGDIKEIADGYARNFLLPQGLAVPATAENVTKIKKELANKVGVKTTVLSTNRQLADKVRGRKIEIKAKANEAGKLYAAVSEADIKLAVKKLGIDLVEAKIISEKHLKEAGNYNVTIDFGHGVKSAITVVVVI